MGITFRKLGLILAPMILSLMIIGCNKDQNTPLNVRIDLAEIRDRGTLRAITTYSSTSYFIYRGKPMGYEYELLTRLADFLNLDLELVIAKNLDSLYVMLQRGDGDIIAHGLTVTKNRQKLVSFAREHLTTRQVLVQRKPDNWHHMKIHEIERALIRNPVDLIGKEVHVRKESAYYDRLLNLSEEIGGDIKIVVEPGDLETENLIQMVADGEIDYTVADNYIAAINKTYYTNLDIKTAISLPQRIAWAVRKTSPDLLKAVNAWIDMMKKDTDYYVIYNKYFTNEKAYRRRIRSNLYSKATGQISEYDSLIRVSSEQLGWDWRLLASMIYQESRFDSTADSWAGAEGLMQMIPAIADQFGDYDLNDPAQSIEAGTRYLLYLQNIWKDIPDSLDRIKFVLASYNVGENHVMDARRLAEKYGADPDVWDENVAKYLLNKSKSKYYNDEVVRYGYCRGSEPYNYVNDILKRYDEYRMVIPLLSNE
jgi:membrane-bound lytic murein transglycosylase F